MGKLFKWTIVLGAPQWPAWRKERRQILRRLLRSWHPDKHHKQTSNEQARANEMLSWYAAYLFFVWRMFEFLKITIKNHSTAERTCETCVGVALYAIIFSECDVRKDFLLHPNVTRCFLTRSCMKFSRSSSTANHHATRATECCHIGERLWCNLPLRNFNGLNGSGEGTWRWKFCSFAMSQKVETANNMD